VILFGCHAARRADDLSKALRENDARIRAARGDAAGADRVRSSPYSHFGTLAGMLATISAYASLREYVEHEVFGIAGIEFDRPVRAEPSPPYTMSSRSTTTRRSPRPTSSARSLWPLSYVPSYVDRDIQLIRRSVAQLAADPGHHLRSVAAIVRGFDLPEAARAPLYAVRMARRQVRHGRRSPARRRRQPSHFSCGARRSRAISRTPTWSRAQGRSGPAVEDSPGRRMTFDYACRGLYVADQRARAPSWLLAARPWR